MGSWLVRHSFRRLHFVCDWEVSLGDLMGDFLVGLDDIAAHATPCLQAVDWEISLNVIPFANLALLNELEDNRKANAAGEPETQTCGIDWGESLKVGVFS